MKDIESDLIRQTEEARSKEMDKYGRKASYAKIRQVLTGDVLEGFMLINYAMALVDDKLDKGEGLDYIKKLKVAFLDANIDASKDHLIEYIIQLRKILEKLQNSGFKPAPRIRKEILNYWEADSKNLMRKGKVLSQKEIDFLDTQIGGTVGAQFLYFLCPDLDSNLMQSLAQKYGHAIKAADNLSDLDEDLKIGYINISQENIKRYNLNVTLLDSKRVVIKGNLAGYKTKELTRIKKLFKKADSVFNKVSKINGEEIERLALFRDIAISWLKQAMDIPSESSKKE